MCLKILSIEFTIIFEIGTLFLRNYAFHSSNLDGFWAGRIPEVTYYW